VYVRAWQLSQTLTDIMLRSEGAMLQSALLYNVLRMYKTINLKLVTIRN
jgi:hypothetical protein